MKANIAKRTKKLAKLERDGKDIQNAMAAARKELEDLAKRQKELAKEKEQQNLFFIADFAKSVNFPLSENKELLFGAMLEITDALKHREEEDSRNLISRLLDHYEAHKATQETAKQEVSEAEEAPVSTAGAAPVPAFGM